MTEVYIYALIDPTTFEPRYVGQTSNPIKRLKDHLTELQNRDKREWICTLRAQNLKPVMKLLESTDDIGAGYKEIYWLNLFRCFGFSLLNKRESPCIKDRTRVIEREIIELLIRDKHISKVERLSKKLGLKHDFVIELAIRKLAQKEKIS